MLLGLVANFHFVWLIFLAFTGCVICIWTTFRGHYEVSDDIFLTFSKLRNRYGVKPPKKIFFSQPKPLLASITASDLHENDLLLTRKLDSNLIDWRSQISLQARCFVSIFAYFYCQYSKYRSNSLKRWRKGHSMTFLSTLQLIQHF